MKYSILWLAEKELEFSGNIRNDTLLWRNYELQINSISLGK
jgi:hypothetical protein